MRATGLETAVTGRRWLIAAWKWPFDDPIPLVKMRNTRKEQMISGVLPGADIRRTERDVCQHFSGLPASRQGMLKAYFSPHDCPCVKVRPIGLIHFVV
jgi:hypothetical protein